MCCHSHRHTIGPLGHVTSRWAEGLAPLSTWRAVEGGTNRIYDRKLCPRSPRRSVRATVAARASSWAPRSNWLRSVRDWSPVARPDAAAPFHSGEGAAPQGFSANVFKMQSELYAAAVKRSSLYVCTHTHTHTYLCLPWCAPVLQPEARVQSWTCPAGSAGWECPRLSDRGCSSHSVLLPSNH